MARFIVLDSGPVGALCNPLKSPTAQATWDWAEARLADGDRMILPEIADYEVRRELLRSGKTRSVLALDDLFFTFEYLPLSTAAMRKAAELWAASRNAGRPTAGPQSLDGDVILAAQALLLPGEGDEVVVATTNPAHLAPLVAARVWHEIA